MIPMLSPLQSTPFEPIHPPGTTRDEIEIISARVASAAKWRRRRARLRLRVALFGRRKERVARCADGATTLGTPQSA